MAHAGHKSEANPDKLHKSLSSSRKPSSKCDPAFAGNIGTPRAEMNPQHRLTTPTFSENFPGLQVEAIRGSNASHHLVLCVNDSRTTEICRSLQHHDTTYVPGSIPAGLGQFVRFPTMPSAPSSGQDLAGEIKAFLSKYLDQEPQTIDLLIAFTFASWFVGFFDVAPILRLYGPDFEVCLVLRLLSTMCYHPLLVSDLDFSALRTLPRGLTVTLLISKPDLARGVERALSNSVRRQFCFARGAQPVNMYGARALHCHAQFQGIGVTASIDPARHQLPLLTEQDELRAARFFQEHLLAYRLSRYADVQNFEVHPDARYFGFLDEIKTWLGALPSNSDAKKSVFRAFENRCEESFSARFQDPACLVVEVALMFCHMNGAKQFFVRELAERVNHLLVARHVDTKLEDRKIGSVLKSLGIHTSRVAKGYRVVLTPQVRQRIHSAATAYRVLSTLPRCVRCADCKMDH